MSTVTSLFAPADDPRIITIIQLARELAEMRDDFTYSATRYNRLYEKMRNQLVALTQDPDHPELLRFLLNYPEPAIAMAAAWHCGRNAVLFDEADTAMTAMAKRKDAAGQQAQSWLDARVRMAEAAQSKPAPETKKMKTIPFAPLPAGRTRAAAEALIRARLPERADDIIPLLRRAIGLWPKRADSDPRASRFGGHPVLPAGDEWPRWDDEDEGDGEPLAFLAQINLADLHAAVGETLLPAEGLLQVYGHPDDLCGTFPTFACKLLHVTDLDDLEPADEPEEGVQARIRCGLAFYETVELPDLKSDVGQGLGLSDAEAATYLALRSELPAHGVPFAQAEAAWHSKLFGWPDLVQDELMESGDLLMQIAGYHDGQAWEGWDPGGSVYVLLDEADARDEDFEAAQMVVQMT